MKKYNAIAQDANNNTIQLFVGIDEVAFNEFLNDYCEPAEKYTAPWDKNSRWLKDHDLPEYNVPYRAMGWIVRFCEA